MTMNYHHQLELLKDILQNQQDEHYGTHDEYEQMQLLVQNLLQNPSVPAETKSILMQIDQYANEHNREGYRGNISTNELQQLISGVQI